MKRYEDGQNPRKTDLQPGDLVLARNFGRKKGDARWIGPFPVIEQQDRHVRIKNIDGRERVLNIADVKRWKEQIPLDQSVGDDAVGDATDEPINPGAEVPEHVLGG